jgi:hypothetical protein
MLTRTARRQLAEELPEPVAAQAGPGPNPSPAAAAHVWSGGSKPEPAAIPKWPDDSVGDRSFNTWGIAAAAEAPPIVGATLPAPGEMAATSELWVVATSALVRAVVLDGLTVCRTESS